jgi:hypothetical protein
MSRARDALVLACLVAWLAGCATPPRAPVNLTPLEELEPDVVPAPTLLVEYPPIEAVEPLPPPSTPGVAPTAAPGQGSVAMAAPSPQPAVAPPVLVPEPNTDDLQLIALLGDLQRFGNLSPDELRREMAAATQTLARQRSDANRVRLAVLYSLSRASPQDDQRALQLLDNVAKGGPGSASIKQLAVVLQAQISERLRAVRDEQQGRGCRAEAGGAAADGAQPDARPIAGRWRRWRGRWRRWWWWRWRRRRLTPDAEIANEYRRHPSGR